MFLYRFYGNQKVYWSFSCFILSYSNTIENTTVNQKVNFIYFILSYSNKIKNTTVAPWYKLPIQESVTKGPYIEETIFELIIIWWLIKQKIAFNFGLIAELQMK